MDYDIMDQKSLNTSYADSDVENIYETPNDSYNPDGRFATLPQRDQGQYHGDSFVYPRPDVEFDGTEAANRSWIPGESLDNMDSNLEDHSRPLEPRSLNIEASYGFREDVAYRPYTENEPTAPPSHILNHPTAGPSPIVHFMYSGNVQISRYATEVGPWDGISRDGNGHDFYHSTGNPRFSTRQAPEPHSLEANSAHHPFDIGVSPDIRVATRSMPFPNHDIPSDQYAYHIPTPASHPMEREQGYQSYYTPPAQQEHQTSPPTHPHNQPDECCGYFRMPTYAQPASPLPTALGQSSHSPWYKSEGYQQPGLDVNPNPISFNPGNEQILVKLSTEYGSSIGQQIPQSAYVYGRPEQMQTTDNIFGTALDAPSGDFGPQYPRFHDYLPIRESLQFSEGSIVQLDQVSNHPISPHPHVMSRRESAPEILQTSEPTPKNKGSYQILDASMQPVKQRRIRRLSSSGRAHAKEVRRRGACTDCRRKKCKCNHGPGTPQTALTPGSSVA